MNKAFDNFQWRDYPSTDSPMNRSTLMKINNGLNEVDNRVIALDTTKFNKTEAQGLVKSLTFNPDNGVFTITYYNGSTATIDTLLEKLAVNFDFDETTQKMIIYLADGTTKEVDLSAFIVPLEFVDSDTVDFQILETGKVTAIVKEGSIQEEHLQPNYLADIKVEVAKAEASAAAADASKAAAAVSASAASTKAGEAAASAQGAANSATTAREKAEEAAGSADDAAESVATATQKATDARNSADAAVTSATNAASSAITATSKANSAATSAENAAGSATNADAYAKKSQSYAVGGTGTREGEDADNSQYYYEQTKRISQSVNGIIPMGTITFAELSNPDNQQSGYFFNISDSFVSDERFKDGSWIFYGAGNNVLRTADGFWDVTAASMVSGVKGDAETEYRQGFVNLTPEDIGALPEDGNAASATKAHQDGNGNIITDTYALKTEMEAVKKSVSDGKTLVANAITAKGVTTATDATFETMANNIAMISSGGTPSMAHKVIGVTPGKGNTTATAKFSISDGGTYLIIATVGEVNPSSAYDGIDLVQFLANGEEVGESMNDNRINAPGINQGSILRKNYYYIAHGNQEVSVLIRAHTFNALNQPENWYGMASYAEIIAFKIS